MATSANVKITNIPGYFPLHHDPTFQDLFRSNATRLLGRERISFIPENKSKGGSTDMGDLSQIMPVCHPYAAGATGPGHSKQYSISDYEQAVLNPARIMAMVVIDLLAEGAAKAREIIANATPAMTKEEYVSLQRSRATVEQFDGADL